MGALIQTKGTRLLSAFFSNQFGPGDAQTVNLGYLRTLGLDFQNTPSIFRASEKFRFSGPAAMPLFYPFPSAPVSASTAAGSSILTFNGAAPFAVVPPWVTVGTFVVADGSPGAIPPGTKVQSVPSNTTVNMSNNVNGGKTIQTGKPITFVTFPVLTLVTTAASATGTLTFASVPNRVANGMGVVDFTNPAAIPRNTTVSGKTATTVSITNPATAVANGDVIAFLGGGNHQNLLRRWKHFLKNELDPGRDAEIRAALQDALDDTDIARVEFDVIEGTSQIVHTAVEYDFDVNNGVLSNKYIRIVLETPPTKASIALPAPIPLDDQFS